MSEYTPDCWVIVQIPTKHPNQPAFHKVLGGWAGGYLDGNSWRLNSGITKVEKDGCHKDFDEVFYIYGNSSSKYICSWDSYGLRFSTAGIAQELARKGCKILNEQEAMEYLYDMSSKQVSGLC